MSKLSKEELLSWLNQSHRYFTFEPPGKDEQGYQQIKEMIQKKPIKLYEANIKWIEDIIDLVMENVSCDHQSDSDGAGKIYDSASYHLNDEEQVFKKCVEAIPELPLEFAIKVDEKFIAEKTMQMIEIVSGGKILDSMSFIRSLINEVLDKINLKGD